MSLTINYKFISQYLRAFSSVKYTLKFIVLGLVDRDESMSLLLFFLMLKRCWEPWKLILTSLKEILGAYVATTHGIINANKVSIGDSNNVFSAGFGLICGSRRGNIRKLSFIWKRRENTKDRENERGGGAYLKSWSDKEWRCSGWENENWERRKEKVREGKTKQRDKPKERKKKKEIK